MSTSLDAKSGAKIYNPWVLKLYDFWVLGLSNRFAWRCPTSDLLKLYNENIGASHLDVGVGTGWYLSHCRYPVQAPQITLLDLNSNSLKAAARRIAPLKPDIVQTNVLEALPDLGRKFDSIAVNYLLHCLPDAMKEKMPRVLAHLSPWLKDAGVFFGATILGQGATHNAFGKKLMSVYNRKGIFSNGDDQLEDLDRALRQDFQNVQIRVQGTVAIFAARSRV